MKSDKNPQKIKSMFDEISVYYDKMNNILSVGLHYLIKYFALRELNIEKRSNVLDLCCGTGDIVRIISKYYPRAKVIGLDFSPKMIKIAKDKNHKGIFIQGDCTNLPFKDREFNYITMSFGLRNIEDRQKVLNEIYRVLDKDGKFMHLDFGYHNCLSKIFNIYAYVMVKLLGKNEKHYEYLIKSKDSFLEPNELIKEFEGYGFRCIKICNYLFGSISAQILVKQSKYSIFPSSL